MKCVNGVCVKDYLIEKNSTQCGYDPCKNVNCGTVCRNYDLWIQECVDGTCVDDRLLEANSLTCGYDPCTNIQCRDICKGYDLWSQKCVDGACVDDQLLEADSLTCGFDPCEGQGHCTNGVQDCGEYGIDCGGGCPFIDSDNDSVEDCKDLCMNSRCNKVDTQGCETDIDGDNVYDCEDDCPNEPGEASNRGCPNNMNLILILGGIGGIIIIGGGLIFWNFLGGRGGGPPGGGAGGPPGGGAGGPPGGGAGGPPGGGAGGQPIARPPVEDMAARKEIAEEIAKQTAKEVAEKKAGTKLAEEASKQAGTKLAEEASKQAGTKLAEEASKQAGTKLAEEASKSIGTKAAEGAAGMGIAGVVGKELKETYCPQCGQKLPRDSKFCSKCGYDLSQ
ncbi:MAG: zinc-ribbon domain-containing protein [Theionarchaea archaeon]|nr:zinc-ribbon domain-containing protein [Theionarchaea archaeon]